MAKNKFVLIGIQKVPNPDHMNFHMKEETRKHLELGRRLLKIPGTIGEIGENFPICMDHKGNYNFGISKAKMFSWEREMLPNIKREIRTYFREKGKTVRFVNLPDLQTKMEYNDFSLVGIHEF